MGTMYDDQFSTCGLIDLGSVSCSVLKCANGGTCLNSTDGATCVCMEGYTGVVCQYGTYTQQV